MRYIIFFHPGLVLFNVVGHLHTDDHTNNDKDNEDDDEANPSLFARSTR